MAVTRMISTVFSAPILLPTSINTYNSTMGTRVNNRNSLNSMVGVSCQRLYFPFAYLLPVGYFRQFKNTQYRMNNSMHKARNQRRSTPCRHRENCSGEFPCYGSLFFYG